MWEATTHLTLRGRESATPSSNPAHDQPEGTPWFRACWGRAFLLWPQVEGKRLGLGRAVLEGQGKGCVLRVLPCSSPGAAPPTCPHRAPSPTRQHPSHCSPAGCTSNLTGPASRTGSLGPKDEVPTVASGSGEPRMTPVEAPAWVSRKEQPPRKEWAREWGAADSLPPSPCLNHSGAPETTWLEWGLLRVAAAGPQDQGKGQPDGNLQRFE